MNKKSATDVLERLKLALGASSDSELCRMTGVNRQTLGNWKGRDSVPYPLCVKISEDMGISLDWLLTGEGQMYKNAPPPDQPMQVLSPKERALLEMFKELSDKDQREICRDAEEKKRTADLERRLKELELFVEQQKNVG